MRKRQIWLLLASLTIALWGCGAVEANRIQSTPALEDTEGKGKKEEQVSGETFPEETPEETAVSYKAGRKGDEYILPDAQEHTYTREELKELTADELRLARNEIYARRGRMFKSQDLADYFTAKSWYHGSAEPDSFDDHMLNQNEKDNLKLIQHMEKETSVCQAPKIGVDEFPAINGSTATIPISQALYRMTTGASAREAEGAVSHSKTANAWLSLTVDRPRSDGRQELVIAYEPGDNVRESMENSKVKIIMKPIGMDALVFMANASNPVHSLTSSQIVDIYSGRTDNWKDVGGRSQEIQAFQRPEDSGSQNLMNKLVMKGRAMAKAPSDQMISDMEGLMECVSAYDNTGSALGYSVYYYARNMYKKPELAFMAVDGVTPSESTIRDKSYPFISDFYAGIRADTPKESAAYRLFEWLTSEDGQSLINGLGYVGVEDWEKALPEELMDSGTEENFTASISLPKGYVILASGEYMYGETGIAVFDSRMRLLQFIGHVQSDDVGIFMECSSDTVLLLRDTLTGEYGNYSISENRWVDKWEDNQDEIRYSDGEDNYSLSQSFAEDHPELMEKYGVDAQAVETQIMGEYLMIMVIHEGTVDHYYDVHGNHILDYDTKGKDGREEPGGYVYPVDEHTAYLYKYGRDTGVDYYHIYRDGVPVKVLESVNGRKIDMISTSFYTVNSGNYMYIYNYDDEPCARFLEGYTAND